MQLEDFNYELPAELVARHPAERRDESRLMILDRQAGSIEHRVFRDVVEFLRPGDLLALNDSRVIPARLYAKRAPGGGRVELLLVEEVADGRWRCLVRPARKIGKGVRLIVEQGRFEAIVEEFLGDGLREVSFLAPDGFWAALRRWGQPPLPPYILKARRDFEGSTLFDAGDQPGDRERYQTVYAVHDGSVAAPTAGLHFTEELLAGLRASGVKQAHCTLHVGPGTFLPVKTERVEDHPMHAERFSLDEGLCRAVEQCRTNGGRIVAVGTTSVRALETAMLDGGPLKPQETATRLMILPGFEFRLTDALLTNFHLPRSTLLMLVSALAGREFILEAYREAVREGYRFYSYGDAMLIV
jgi:S-adenosylmethionine:tRNA ribosyltransferase-isomerase